LEVAVFRLDCIPARDSLEEPEGEKASAFDETAIRISSDKKWLAAVSPSFLRREAGPEQFAHMTSTIKSCLPIFVALVVGIGIGLNLAPDHIKEIEHPQTPESEEARLAKPSLSPKRLAGLNRQAKFYEEDEKLWENEDFPFFMPRAND